MAHRNALTNAEGDDHAKVISRSPSYSPSLPADSATTSEHVRQKRPTNDHPQRYRPGGSASQSGSSRRSSRSQSRSPSRQDSSMYEDVDESPRRNTRRSEAQDRSIEVEGLTRMVFEEHLRQIFRPYGRVIDVYLPLDRRLGESKGTACLTFDSEAGAQRAVEHMNDGQIDGAMISVRILSVDELKARRFSIRDDNDKYGPRNSRDRRRDFREQPIAGHDRGDHFARGSRSHFRSYG